MVSASAAQHSGLIRALIQHGRLSEADAAACMQNASDYANAYIIELAQRGLIDTAAVARFAAETFGHPLVDLAALDPASFAHDAVDRKLAIRHQVVALARRQNRLTLAVADPSNARALDEIRFQTGMQLDLVVAEADKLARAVDSQTESAEQVLKALTGEESGFDLLRQDGQPEAGDKDSSEVDDAPVVRFIQKVLIDAINEGASDIHFEPYEKYFRIRVRTDGVLREVARPPLVLKDRIAARIKVISRLDIAERRVPQDGRMKLTLSRNKFIDFRVSTLPTLYGEKLVMRILDSSATGLGIDALGYEPQQKAALLEAISRPYGMILATGPTGAGKTVSLYACLGLLNKVGVNISTAEDPAEINLPGVNQVNVNEKTGLSFAAALRAFLRQDPDVIMVGEIRDLETADIAVKAAQTGHLVLSTVHTNDAPSTLERLRNIGVAPFNIASSVVLITAQRLARRLCSCKKPVDIPLSALRAAGFATDALDGSWQAFGPAGCERCKNSGYRGRVGIFQVMPVSEAMARIIMNDGHSMEIAAQAKREGVLDLRQAGLLKVRQGITSLEEVLATTND